MMRREFFWFSVFSCLLLISDLKLGLSWPKHTVQDLFKPIDLGFYALGSSLAQKVEFIQSLPLIHEENRRLKEDLSRLKYLTLENEVLREEVGALKEQMQILGTDTENLIEARVLGETSLGDQIVLRVDKGLREKVRTGQTVVLGRKLIGRVIKVEPNISYVLPIFANTSRVPVLVGISEEVHGLVVGRFNTQLYLTQVLPEEDIKRGNLILTSGEAGLFPPHLLVGEVAKVEKSDSRLYVEAEVSPFWKASELEIVFIIQ